MCDFPVLPLAQALHLGDASCTEGGEMLEQKKPQNPLLITMVNTVYADPCPFGHRPSQSALFPVPSHLQTGTQAGWGWGGLKTSYPKSRSSANNQHPPSGTQSCPRCFRITLSILFHLGKALLWGQSALPSHKRCRPCSIQLLHPPVGPKGPPVPSHNPPAHQKILPSILQSRNRIHGLRIVLEKLPGVCLRRKTSYLTPPHHRDVIALSTAVFAASFLGVLNCWN